MLNKVVSGLLALCGVGVVMAVAIAAFIFAPNPDAAHLIEAYKANPWFGTAPMYDVGLVVMLFFNLWPLIMIFGLAVMAAWLWAGRSRDTETTAYLEHAHALEVALRQARDQADFAGTAWETLNAKLDDLFARTTELMVVVHPINGIRRYNPAALALAKRTNPGAVSLEGRPLSELIADATFNMALQAANTEGKVWQGEVHISGLGQWFLAWILPFGNEVLVVLRDITALHQSTGLQQSAELVLRQVIEESVRPVALFDADWKYLYHSFKWPDTLGLVERGSLIGQDHWVMCPHFPANKGVLMQQLASGQVLGPQEERTTLNGQEQVFSWFVRPWKDSGGRLGGYLFGVQDVTDYNRLKQQVAMAEDRENQLAYADALTGLPNRQLFNDRLNVALAQAYRNLSKMAVLFLDLDGFKGVNDKLGHAAGDLLLKQVAERLKTCVRTSDTLARLGGDEFTMILNIRDAADAEVVAQKTLQIIREPYNLNGVTVDTVGTSIGVALYPQNGTQAADLIKAADNAMYAAKEAGKNTYRFAVAPSVPKP